MRFGYSLVHLGYGTVNHTITKCDLSLFLKPSSFSRLNISIKNLLFRCTLKGELKLIKFPLPECF